MSDVPIFYNLQTAGDVTAITGKLADLETTVKTNLVAAINELDANFPVSVANGGTGQTSLTSGNILIGNGTSAIDSVDVLPITKGGTGGTTATAARTNLGVMTGVQLYDNSSGTRSTITLSDTIENYKLIKIYAKNSDGRCDSFNIWHNGATEFYSTISITTSYIMSNENRATSTNVGIAVSANAITWDVETYMTFRPSSPQLSVGASTKILIYRVEGYKY